MTTRARFLLARGVGALLDVVAGAMRAHGAQMFGNGTPAPAHPSGRQPSPWAGRSREALNQVAGLPQIMPGARLLLLPLTIQALIVSLQPGLGTL